MDYDTRQKLKAILIPFLIGGLMTSVSLIDIWKRKKVDDSSMIALYVNLALIVFWLFGDWMARKKNEFMGMTRSNWIISVIASYLMGVVVYFLVQAQM